MILNGLPANTGFEQVTVTSGINCVPGTWSCHPPWKGWRCPQSISSKIKRNGRRTAELRSDFQSALFAHKDMSEGFLIGLCRSDISIEY